MAIEKRSGKWGYRFKVRGQEYRGSTGLPATRENKAEAEKIAAAIRMEITAGAEQRQQLSADLQFADAADEFLRWCYTTEYRSKQSTAARIKTSFASLMAFFNCRVSEITPRAVELYKTWRIETNGVANITLRHDLHALSVFFRKYAVKSKWALDNPTRAVTKPSGEAHRMHILSHDEEDAYFDAAGKHRDLYDLARLMILQGCRPDEILSLQQSAVNLQAGTMQVIGGKSEASKRLLDLTDESLDILTRRLEAPGKWVFPSDVKAGCHLTKLNNAHNAACKESGTSFVLYDLRHTFATRMITEQKADAATVCALLGHSTPIMVLKNYVHPSAEGKRRAMKDYSKSVRPRLKRVK